MRRPLKSRLFALTLLPLAVLCPSCSDDSSVHDIESTRVVEASGPTPSVDSGRRFGVRTSSDRAAAGSASAEIAWDLPAGWTALPPSQMRIGSFTAPGGVECSLITLGGAAGGLPANVNRWRGQLGLPPLSPEEVEALPRQEMLGGLATRVDLTGAYSGMGDVAVEDDAALLGTVLMQSTRTVFVKLFGPSGAVEAQREAFDGFVASLHAGEAPTQAPASAGAGAGVDPHTGALAGMQVVTPGDGAALQLRWAAPAEWTQGDPRPMRVVTYSPAAHPNVECYVVVLQGDGGGVFANATLWRQQMGLPPAGPSESEPGELLQVLGVEAPLYEFTGAGAAQDRAMLGIICPLPGHTVFVKMLGPTDAVAAEKSAFAAFCRSLEK